MRNILQDTEEFKYFVRYSTKRLKFKFAFLAAGCMTNIRTVKYTNLNILYFTMRFSKNIVSCKEKSNFKKVNAILTFIYMLLFLYSCRFIDIFCAVI